jgi:IS30 family transposase
LSGYSQEQLDAIADQINGRPRKGLGVRSPLAVDRELILNSSNTPPSFTEQLVVALQS